MNPQYMNQGPPIGGYGQGPYGAPQGYGAPGPMGQRPPGPPGPAGMAPGPMQNGPTGGQPRPMMPTGSVVCFVRLTLHLRMTLK